MVRQLFACLLMVWAFLQVPDVSFAQTQAQVPVQEQEEETIDPDEAGAAMPNIGILEAEPIIEIVEGVGAVLFSNVAFRSTPEADGALIRYAAQGERVLLIGEIGEWFKVLMYNNAEAFISKKYVRTNKIAKDERTTVNNMDKPTSIIITDIIERFNISLKSSPFAQKFKVIPYINVIDERKVKDKMMLTFVYSCVDLDGKMVPSYKENMLKKEMRSLFEIMFVKLLLSESESYELTIKVPTFTDKGNVKDISKTYAVVTLETKDVDMQTIRQDPAKIWQYAKPSVDINKLFEKFP